MAATSTRITGTSLRSATQMDVAGLLAGLTRQVESDSGLPLLRIHWYDAGTRGGSPTPQQRDIASLPRVKLRLGRLGFNGEQKGVDLKLALDLITQSRNNVAEVVYVVSGDDDLSEAVEEAQHQGVQVIALVVPGETGASIGVSNHLQMTVDQLQLIEATLIDTHVKKSTAHAMNDIAAATVADRQPVPEPPAQREAAEPPPPGAPTPLTVATSRPAPKPAPAALVQVPVTLVYSTTTGHPGGTVDTGDLAPDQVGRAIEFVVERVVSNWWRGASALSHQQLLAGKPTIPGELDRTLLSDLSAKLSVYDVPQEWRFALRDTFWDRVAHLV